MSEPLRKEEREYWIEQAYLRPISGHEFLRFEATVRDLEHQLDEKDAALAVLVEALQHIAIAPCLTELLGENPEDNGGCSCRGCVAREALAACPPGWKETP